MVNQKGKESLNRVTYTEKKNNTALEYKEKAYKCKSKRRKVKAGRRNEQKNDM